MTQCSVCVSPAFDSSPAGPLCLPCLQALAELQGTGGDGSYEQFEQRIFSQLVRELWDAEPALARKVSGIIDDLGWLQVQEGAARLTAAEANYVLGVVLRVVHRGSGAPA